jgi:hypothetical protein
MSAMAVNNSALLQKAFLMMMCATIPGEVRAARDAVLRIAGCSPHELSVSAAVRQNARVMEMAEQILGWEEITPQLTPGERVFVKEMRPGSASTSDIAWLEKIYARVFEEGKQYA